MLFQGLGSERKCRGSESFQSRLFFEEPIFDVLLFKLCQPGFKKPAITVDIVAMRTQTGQFFVDHLRHPLTVALSFL
ncbi:hypothetical protein CQ13_19050 [Bradyrhizobium retamae]|uniref:Uncharacterized protein n=1 Tax=Bradyrhizobium retamae TaxID=1300035 RepID=A0A0R3N963_9BRAD|nr:hypothetical protein CQ13_19050 [Bradyrhizobium retamae]